jgi:hypothetical protein
VGNRTSIRIDVDDRDRNAVTTLLRLAHALQEISAWIRPRPLVYVGRVARRSLGTASEATSQHLRPRLSAERDPARAKQPPDPLLHRSVGGPQRRINYRMSTFFVDLFRSRRIASELD